MIYIYNCYGGTHTSSLASAIHLNKLPLDRVPTKEEILSTAYFNKLNYQDMRRIIFRGIDDEGNKVYSLGRGIYKDLVICLEQLAKILCEGNEIKQRIIFSNMSPTVPVMMTMGGFLSRAMKIDCFGVPLLVAGAKRTYWNIVEVVKHTKEAAETSEEPIMVFDNLKLVKYLVK